jgi:GNAT superfamily N-acetyltransferase
MQIVAPQSGEEWQAYYDFRWRLLRAPWQQAKGSEKDDEEQGAFHIMAKTAAGEIIGVGRIHRVAVRRWQIRYMAVAEQHRNTGIGAKILKTLENHALTQGEAQILLNSRVCAVNFYLKQGYQIIGDAPTMFGTIAHKKMQKILRNFTS